jgi:hypothetical protein
MCEGGEKKGVLKIETIIIHPTKPACHRRQHGMQAMATEKPTSLQRKNPSDKGKYLVTCLPFPS